MPDDSLLAEIEERLVLVERAIKRLAHAGMIMAQNTDITADWMMAMSQRIGRLENGKSKLS